MLQGHTADMLTLQHCNRNANLLQVLHAETSQLSTASAHLAANRSIEDFSKLADALAAEMSQPSSSGECIISHLRHWSYLAIADLHLS